MGIKLTAQKNSASPRFSLHSLRIQVMLYLYNEYEQITPSCLLNVKCKFRVCFKTFVTWIIKLRNFFNICSGTIIQSVVERF